MRILENEFLIRITPKIFKQLRMGIFHLCNLFFKPLYLNFYKKKLEQLPQGIQLFFVGRNDLGTQLYLLNYVKLWEEKRGPTAIVILTNDFERIQKLSSLITPKTHLIFPNKWFVTIPIACFGSRLIHFFTFNKIYPFLANERPDGLNLFYLFGNGITEYNPLLDTSLIQYAKSFSSSFIKAYKAVRAQFDYRWPIFEDFFQVYSKQNNRRIELNSYFPTLAKQLNVSKKFVLLNVNCKDYKYPLSNRRKIHYPERYDILIDILINKGFEVVIQGRGEQPHFLPRKGLIDYARSSLVSIENDLFLFANSEFAITSKSGVEIFASICNVPVLGLNYTEILGMQPAQKLRFYPKTLRHIPTGKKLSWKEHISSPCFFEIGENEYSNGEYEYEDMTQEEMVQALEEFLNIQEWEYTPLQQEFKNALTPLHLELFLAKGVPCNAYLEKRI